MRRKFEKLEEGEGGGEFGVSNTAQGAGFKSKQLTHTQSRREYDVVSYVVSNDRKGFIRDVKSLFYLVFISQLLIFGCIYFGVIMYIHVHIKIKERE